MAKTFLLVLACRYIRTDKSFDVTGFVRYAFQFVNYILLGGSETGQRVLFLIYVCCE